MLRTITGADSVHPFAVMEHLEGTVPHPPEREQIPPAVTELSGLRGLLDERVVALAGQQLLAGAGPGAEGASSRAPLPLGSVPAGAGSSGGLGGSDAATGLAALALLLFLLRVGGSLSWSWCELLGPSWAPIAITERPG